MKWDLRTPCKNCPFRSDETRIKFFCRERAEEIAESAYRHGFPCHKSGELVEDEDTWDGESGGYVFGENTQHCAGAILMFLRDGWGNVPFQWLDEDEQDRATARLDYDAPVFESEEAFIEANAKQREPAE